MICKYPTRILIGAAVTGPIALAAVVVLWSFLNSTAKTQKDTQMAAFVCGGVLVSLTLLITYFLLLVVNVRYETHETGIVARDVWGRTAVYMYKDITELNLKYDCRDAVMAAVGFTGSPVYTWSYFCFVTFGNVHKCQFHYTMTGFDQLCTELAAHCPPDAKKVNVEGYME